MLAVLLRWRAAPALKRLLPAAAAAVPVASGGGAARLGGAPGAWQQQLLRQAGTGPVSSADEHSAAAMSGSVAAAGHEQQAAPHAATPPHEQQHFDQHAYDYNSEEEEQHRHYQRPEDDAEFQRQRSQLLAAALRHVPQLGWSGGAAAAAAAAELGLSPAAAGMLGSDAQLVQLFVEDCNRRLEQELMERQAELCQLEVRCGEWERRGPWVTFGLQGSFKFRLLPGRLPGLPLPAAQNGAAVLFPVCHTVLLVPRQCQLPAI